MLFTLVRKLLSTLKPHPRNPRRHPEPQLAILRDSLRVHGQQKPVVITPDDTILAGHGLVEAAIAEGWQEIDCHVYDGPFPEAFLVIDNYSADLAIDDQAMLGALLVRLQEEGQLAATGYTDDGLNSLLALLEAEGPKKEEEWQLPETVPEGPTRTQLGEIWAMGPHRLFVGDCTVEENWERLMQGRQAHAITTDPPYGINYVGGRAAQEERISAYRRGVGELEADAYWDEMSDDEYVAMVVKSMSLAHQFSDDHAPLYIWFAITKLRSLLRAIAEAGWQERVMIAWVKNNGAGALFAQYKHWYEPVYYCFKRGRTTRWHGPTNERTVWEHDKATVNDLHPTMKPLLLIERTIVNSTEPGMLVVDPFMGSGTAIIAAQRMARVAYGFELDLRYCDIILDRWEKLTGKVAERVD